MFPCPGSDSHPKENTLVGGEWKDRALELEIHCMKLERMFEWDKLGTDMNWESHGQATGKSFFLQNDWSRRIRKGAPR